MTLDKYIFDNNYGLTSFLSHYLEKHDYIKTEYLHIYIEKVKNGYFLEIGRREDYIQYER